MHGVGRSDKYTDNARILRHFELIKTSLQCKTAAKKLELSPSIYHSVVCSCQLVGQEGGEPKVYSFLGTFSVWEGGGES